MSKPIRFKFATEKACVAIHKLVCDQPGIDLHTLLKTCYMADKSHLREYGRPIFGARYRAMRFGPVPLEIYELAKGEEYWLAELGLNEFPWKLSGYNLKLKRNARNDCDFDVDALSESDREELADAHKICREMTFSARTEATHGEDWQRAELGMMKYEDMLIGADNYKRKVKHLRENASKMRL